MKRFSAILAVLLVSATLLKGQETDPYSTPPGAPLPQFHVDHTNRIMPNHPGNAGQKVTVSNFTIIESSTSFPGHDMDLVWRSLLIGMGHTATIMPQTTLDNNGFFASTNVLIISSGVLAISPARIAIIQQFLQSGKPVYLQGEYQSSYNSNQAFAAIVGATGGTFTAGSTVSGQLAPTSILNAYATTTNAVASLGYHWYGCTGAGCNNVEYFMRYGASNIGYVYCPTNAAFGDIVQSSDQDWINQSQSLPLMQNIVYHLLSGNACSVVCGTVFGATQMDLSATKAPDGRVRLDWIADGEIPQGRFEVYGNGELLGGMEVPEGAGMHFEWTDLRLPMGLQRYSVRFLDMNGAATLSADTEIDLGMPTPKLHAATVEGGFRVYLSAGSECRDLSLVDAAGRRMALQVGELHGAQGQFVPMDGIAAGVYWVQAKTGTGLVLQAKLVWMD